MWKFCPKQIIVVIMRTDQKVVLHLTTRCSLLFTFLISYPMACEESAAQIKTHIRLHHFSLQFMQSVDFSYLMMKRLFTVVNLNPTHWSSFHVNFHGQAVSSSLPVPLKASSPASLQRKNGFSLNLWCSLQWHLSKRFDPKLAINQISKENNPNVLFCSCLPTPEPIVEIRRFLPKKSKSGEFGPL